MPQHVVIAGGGFGGYYTAKTLERTLLKDVRITLVSDINFMLYVPLLPGAAAGSIEARHVVMPLRERLKRTELRLGSVTGGDPAANRLCATLTAGQEVELTYDQLIVALGSVSRTLPIPGLTEHAMPQLAEFTQGLCRRPRMRAGPRSRPPPRAERSGQDGARGQSRAAGFWTCGRCRMRARGSSLRSCCDPGSQGGELAQSARDRPESRWPVPRCRRATAQASGWLRSPVLLPGAGCLEDTVA